jgi:hypothetical protein
MPEIPRSPCTANQVDLDTSLTEEIRVPSYPSVSWIADQFERTVVNLGIPVEREAGEVVVRYRYSIADALRLGSSWRSSEELLQALLSEYPALASDCDRLRQRLQVLRAEYEEGG